MPLFTDYKANLASVLSATRAKTPQGAKGLTKAQVGALAKAYPASQSASLNHLFLTVSGSQTNFNAVDINRDGFISSSEWTRLASRDNGSSSLGLSTNSNNTIITASDLSRAIPGK